MDVLVITTSNLISGVFQTWENVGFAFARPASMGVQGCFRSPSACFNLVSEPPSLNRLSSRVAQCFLSESFSYCRLDIPTRPPAAPLDGNEIPRPPPSTSTRWREWEAVEIQTKSYLWACAFIARMSECIGSEWVPLSIGFYFFLDLLPIYW